MDKRGHQEGEQAEVKVSPQILPEIVCKVPRTYVCVEAQSVMLEEQDEAKDWGLVKDDQCPVEAAQGISVKLHNVLLSLTTGEANAAIRRCRGNGLWAWKKLSATLNTRTLASGVKAISQVLNPGKITNAPEADPMIDAWEDRMAKLGAEYGEELPRRWSVLHAMLYKTSRKEFWTNAQ